MPGRIFYPARASQSIFPCIAATKKRDWKNLPKSKVAIELVQLLISILTMSVPANELAKTFREIPLEKLPKHQYETMGYGNVIDIYKIQFPSNESEERIYKCEFHVRSQGGCIILKDGLVIEQRKFKNQELKKFLKNFAEIYFCD